MKLRVGEAAKVTRRIGEDEVRRFADLLGDRNPLHVDEDFAKTTRFGGRIAHGMLVASLISSVIGNRLPGHGTIYLSQTLRFLAPVYLGDTVTAEVQVAKIREDKHVITLETTCVNQRQETVIAGEAVVLLESRSDSADG